MLSSSVSGTPFSVRDILSEDQQLGIMDCYPSVHHQHQLQQQHVPQEYYGYNIVPENNWDVEKFKEQSMPAYPHFPDLGHVHQLNQIAPPYQDPPVTEDGAYKSVYFMLDPLSRLAQSRVTQCRGMFHR